MNKYEAFEKLKEYSKNLSTVSYDEIYDLMQNGIKHIPIQLAKVRYKINIDRVRPNKGKELFNHIDQLGYIKDKDIIENYLTSLGRANNSHQVMFYGALETSKIDRQRLTAIAETSYIFRENKDCLEGEYYTVSRWETKKEFLVVEVVFSEFALKNSPDIARSFEKQKQMLLELNLGEDETNFHLDFLKFISEEFSKKVSNEDEYKISVAYTNLSLNHPDAKGIIYPSVQTEYFGSNIVLTPNSVDELLKPINCSTQIVYKKGEKSIIANGGHYCDNIDFKKNLEWKEQEENLLSSKEEIQERLK